MTEVMAAEIEKQMRCLALIASEKFGLDQEDERLEEFCDDKPNRNDTDTFNECIEAGWIRSWRNDLTDSGGCEITDAGRAALRALSHKGSSNG